MILEKLISLIAPDDCMVCGREGRLLCLGCQNAEILNAASKCYHCGAISPSFNTCPKCRRVSPLSAVFVASVYEGKTKDLVRSYKFASRRGAAVVMSDMMLNILPMIDNCVVCAVPTSTQRIRQRGFDHATRLASLIANSAQLSIVRPLIRLKPLHQVGSDRKKRIEQVKGAFLVARPNLIEGKNVLLVDDVMTTGATIEECARVLRHAGAKQIYAVVFAH